MNHSVYNIPIDPASVVREEVNKYPKLFGLEKHHLKRFREFLQKEILEIMSQYEKEYCEFIRFVAGMDHLSVEDKASIISERARSSINDLIRTLRQLINLSIQKELAYNDSLKDYLKKG